VERRIGILEREIVNVFFLFYCAYGATTYIDFEHTDCEVGITPRPGRVAGVRGEELVTSG
jgi:hypothetical protein